MNTFPDAATLWTHSCRANRGDHSQKNRLARPNHRHNLEASENVRGGDFICIRDRKMVGMLRISIHAAIPVRDAGFAALVAPSLAFLQLAVPL